MQRSPSNYQVSELLKIENRNVCNFFFRSLSTNIPLTSETVSFCQPSSFIDRYSLLMSELALGSAKLSRSSLTISIPVSSSTPHAKQSGVKEAYWKVNSPSIISSTGADHEGREGLTFAGIRLLLSAPFSKSNRTILTSPAATAKHSAEYGRHERDGSAPRRNRSSITVLTSFKLRRTSNGQQPLSAV